MYPLVCTVCLRKVRSGNWNRERWGKGVSILDRMVSCERLIFLRRSEGSEGLSDGKAGRGNVNAKSLR